MKKLSILLSVVMMSFVRIRGGASSSGEVNTPPVSSYPFDNYICVEKILN